MAQQQKAVFVKALGNPVELGERDIPTPKEGQVLVKVVATMLLPHDTYSRDWGLFIGENLPYVLGSSVAGIVTESGAGVTAFHKGDRVFGMSDQNYPTPDQAGLQEYAVLNANAIAKSPEKFTDEELVTLPINLVTSWAVIFTSAGFEFSAPLSDGSKAFDYASQSIVVIGGGSNVGKITVQLASVAGIGKIVAIAGSSNKDALLEMGATHVVDRRAEPADIVAQVHSITGKDGATLVCDCVNMEYSLATTLLPASIPSRLRTLLPLAAFDKTLRPQCNAEEIQGSNDLLAPNQTEFWERVPKLLEGGKVLPTDFRVIQGLEKVDEINAALDGYQDFGRSGVKQVVVKV